MSEDLRRALQRIYDTARSEGISLGPVLCSEDFLLYPERLADLFDEACDKTRSIEGLAEHGSISLSQLEEIASDLRAASYNVEDAIKAAKPKAKGRAA